MAGKKKRGNRTAEWLVQPPESTSSSSAEETMEKLNEMKLAILEVLNDYAKEANSRTAIIVGAMLRDDTWYTKKETGDYNNAFGELRGLVNPPHDRWWLMGDEERKKIKDALLYIITSDHPNKYEAARTIPVENDEDSLKLFEATLSDPKLRNDAFYLLKHHSSNLKPNYRMKLISSIIDSLSAEQRPEIIKDGLVTVDELATNEVAKAMASLRGKLDRLKAQNPAVSDEHISLVYYALTPEKRRIWREKLAEELRSSNAGVFMPAIHNIKWEDHGQPNLFFDLAYKGRARRTFHESIRRRIPQMDEQGRLTLVGKLIALSPHESNDGALSGIRETFQHLVWDKATLSHADDIRAKISEAEEKYPSHKEHWESMGRSLEFAHFSVHHIPHME